MLREHGVGDQPGLKDYAITSTVGPEQLTPVRHRSGLLTGFLLGVGIIAFLDEAIFHQLLQRHAFYWGTDEHGRILSDGLFHVSSTGLLLWGGFRL